LDHKFGIYAPQSLLSKKKEKKKERNKFLKKSNFLKEKVRNIFMVSFHKCVWHFYNFNGIYLSIFNVYLVMHMYIINYFDEIKER